MNELNELLRIIFKKNVQLAVGCTEPVAVGYLSQEMKSYIDFSYNKVEIKVSKNIFKNGKSVCIPGTQESGLALAAAIGLTKEKKGEGLLVFQGIQSEDIIKAKALMNEISIQLKIAENSPDVFVEITILGSNRKMIGRIAYGHDNITYLELDGAVIKKGEKERASKTIIEDFSIESVFNVVEKISEKELLFLEEGIHYNIEAAREGLRGAYGLGLGKKLKKLLEEKKISSDIGMKSRILTAAAADMRMGGGTCPIMTSGGSGNQGIGVLIPIVVVAEEENISKGRRNRGLLFGHLMNELVKVYSGKLSGMCGCAIGSGIGAVAGIVWMLGGGVEEITHACNAIFANLAGMICDGAKDTCALKLSTCANEAVITAYLAMSGMNIKESVGVVGNSLNHTIRNIGYLSKEAFSVVDEKVLEIITRV